MDRYLKQQGVIKGNVDIKVNQDSILLIEFYVDDIIFGSDDDMMSQTFYKDIQNEIDMSLLAELYLFLGL
jgi:hypothetical protein